MPLVKHSSAKELARDAIVLDLGDLQRQAAAIVADAEARRAGAVAAAVKERERILAGAAEQGRAEGVKAGREEGYKVGLAEGRTAAIAEMKERLAKLDGGWTAALSAFEAGRDELLQHAHRDVVRLAMRIAERVTKRAIAADPSAPAAQLAALLGVVVRPTSLVVRINPADRETLSKALPGLMATFSQAKHVELADDPAIERGSCIAACAAPGGGVLAPGEIDASITTQLDRIAEALLPGEGARADGTGAPTGAAPAEGGAGAEP